MKGKYSDPFTYNYFKFRRWMLDRAIRPLVKWTPQHDVTDGYSLIIACNDNYRPILTANLMMVERQQTTHLDKVYVVFDRTPEEMGREFERETVGRFARLPIEFVYYSPAQVKVAREIDWPWLYAWIGWCQGIELSRTRYSILHDFDAFPVRPDIFEEQYRVIRDRGDVFVGVKYYNGNGLHLADELLTTWELILDGQYLRNHFQPIEMFSKIGRYQGRMVDFDTFLYAQTKVKQRSLARVGANDLVHPSQVISQVVELRNGRRPVPRDGNLMFIPYIYFLAGEDELIRSTTEELQNASWPYLQYFGTRLDLRHQKETNAQWLRTQAERLEHAVAGGVRAPVEAYFDALLRFVRMNPEHTGSAQVEAVSQ